MKMTYEDQYGIIKIQKISFRKAHVRAFLEDIERPTYTKKLEAGSFQIVDIEVNHLLKSDENDLRGPVWYYQNLEDKLLRGSCSGVFREHTKAYMCKKFGSGFFSNNGHRSE